ncbi:hypothetical protein H310_14384 [Aphanomyces invadans]|uniref:Uncharacterized protein n=1 Tax=Aphanomyces invadans TaxID=157072 RepID=A0A024TBE6_9STRA|nr:hypothetical protein H310_14384 [Aphanomyces invadans]ETV90891.1 hypothetical protein H310_14384 [Aphanomyces invadans]|eukprot:XP_008880456.1 hypothetical protein H310_14384 [Aphanomyces invadans]
MATQSPLLFNDAPTQLSPPWASPLSLGLMVTTGAVFGFAMNKGQVHLPHVIQDQMTLSQFTMMKMFLAALGMSALSKAIFRAVRPDDFDAIQKKRATDPSHAGVLTAGGLILGTGMAISGSCPGSVYVQLGAQIPSALPVWGGVLVGTLVTLALIKPLIGQWQESKPKVATIVPVRCVVHAAVGVILIGLAVVLEVFVPERDLQASAWLPTVAGVVVGSLQLPLVLLLRRSLGATQSYKSAIALALYPIRNTRVGKCLHVPAATDLSTFVFVLAVVVGSAVASAVSTDPIPTGPIPSVLSSLVGGALIGVGATVACGCTSGHGLSGAALLMKSSFIVLPAIFVGGIATGLLRSVVVSGQRA